MYEKQSPNRLVENKILMNFLEKGTECLNSGENNSGSGLFDLILDSADNKIRMNYVEKRILNDSMKNEELNPNGSFRKQNLKIQIHWKKRESESRGGGIIQNPGSQI